MNTFAASDEIELKFQPPTPIAIAISDLQVTYVQMRASHECNHCIILFVYLLEDCQRVKTSHAFHIYLHVMINNFHNQNCTV